VRQRNKREYRGASAASDTVAGAARDGFVVSLIAIAIEKVAVPRLNPGAASVLAGFAGGVSGLACKQVMKPRVKD
jgi:hypothetical protein